MKKKHFISVFVMGTALVIFLSPLLTGVEKIDKDSILKTGKEWEDIYMNYRVDESFLDTLKVKIGDNLKIDVYLGTWCPDSRNNVPEFIKIIEAVNQDNLPVNYYNVQRKAHKGIKYFVEDLKVERVPTFIFYRDGKEIGRIVENPKNSLIEDFLEIIF
ncbi:MAG: thioredoxin family protein [Candidatus Aminicenantes bacterium]|nr:MAG: thioredoxin family protein [Candidatus Aminicenantes bacterium]